MKIEMWQEPKVDSTIRLRLTQNGADVILDEVDANGKFKARVLLVNESGLFRYGQTSHSLPKDRGGRIAINSMDPASKQQAATPVPHSVEMWARKMANNRATNTGEACQAADYVLSLLEQETTNAS